MKGGSKRIASLDVIRGLAALSVMLYHYLDKFPRLYIPNGEAWVSFPEGKYGVHAFFLLSGFVITLSMKNITAWQDFVAHRMIRLFPTFWVSVLLTFFIVSLFGLPGREVDFSSMLLNLPMIPLALNIPSVDGVYWSLVYELKFYFWVAVIFLLGLMSKLSVILFWYLLAVLIFIASGLNDTAFGKIINVFFMLDYGALFASGVLLYLIYKNGGNRDLYVSLLVGFVVVILNEPRLHGAIVVAGIYVAFVLMVFVASGVSHGRTLLFIGEISYALYLVHQNIGYVILREMQTFGYEGMLPIAMAVGSSILLASIITYMFEKPAIRVLRRKWKSIRKGVVKAQPQAAVPIKAPKKG